MPKIFFLGRFVNELGRWCTMVALWVFLVDFLELSSSEIAIFFACYAIGALGGGWIGGRLSDHFSPRIALIVGELSIAVVMVGFPLIRTFWVLCLSQMAYGMFQTWCDAGLASIIPRITSEERLTQLNAQVISIESVGVLLGPLLAKVLVDHYGFRFAFYVDVVTSLIGICVVARLNLLEKANVNILSSGARHHMSEVVRSWKYFLTEKKLLGVRVGLAPVLLMSAIYSLEAIYVREILKMSASVLAYSAASFGLGMVLVGYNLMRGDKKISEKFLGWTYIVSAVFGTLYLVTPWLWVFITSCFVWGAAWKYLMVYCMTSIQENSPQDLIGSVASVNNSLMNFSRIPAAAIVLVTFGPFGVQGSALVFGAIVLTSALYFLFRVYISDFFEMSKNSQGELPN